MAEWMRSSLLLLAVTISITTTATISRQPKDINLVCSTSGFTFSGNLVKTHSTNHAQTVDITIGDGTNSLGQDTDCVDSASVDNTADIAFSFAISTYGTTTAGKCGGTSNLDASSEAHIQYSTKARFFITEIERLKIRRVYIYDFLLTCKLDRVKTVTSKQSFTMDSIVEEADTFEDATGTVTFTADLNFVTSPDDSTPKGDTFQITMPSGMLYLQAKESQPAFKMTVRNCIAGTDADPFNPSDVFLTADLYNNGCPMNQDAVTVTDNSAGDVTDIVLNIRAFTIAQAPTDPVNVACQLYVCDKDEAATAHGNKCGVLTTEQCATQIANFDWNAYYAALYAGVSFKRKRRGVVDSEANDLQRNVIVMANQKFVIQTDLSSVACPHPYVYDTVTEQCTKERLLEIKGLRLDIDWRPEYANTSSGEYKMFKKKLSFQLYSLVQGTGFDRTITGLSVTKLTQGSVIVDLLIAYSQDVEPTEAFETFKAIMFDQTKNYLYRVRYLLRIRGESEELVPVVFRDNTASDQRIVYLVVIAAVALIVVMVFAVAYYQVTKMRQRTTTTTTTKPVVGQENSGVEKIPI